MGWLLAALPLVPGLSLLGVLLVGLAARLRRIEAARGSLRAEIDSGSDRMRVGLAQLTSWRASRHGGRVEGPDA